MPMKQPNARKTQVVITGMGLIAALGLDRMSNWEAVRAGRCGVGELGALEQQPAVRKGGGQAPDLPISSASVASPSSRFSDAAAQREVRYLRHALDEALRDAGLGGELPYEPTRCGIVMGTTLHGMRAAGKYFRSDDPTKLRRFQAAAVLAQVLADLPLQGPALTTCAACSSGLSSIGLAVTLLQSGELDLVIAGGYDTISEYVYGGFDALRLIAEGPVRPFCRDREGMKVGEGYGVVVLERSDEAARRGAAQAWPVLGFGETSDAHHLTQPHPQGDGAARAMLEALAQAGRQPGDVGLITAHATGTPNNEVGESAAMARVFGNVLPTVPIVAIKAHLSHTLGGAGAVELILAITAMQHQMAPPTPNVTRELLEYPELRFVQGDAIAVEIRCVMNSSFGFGGANACIIVGSPDSEAEGEVDRSSESLGAATPAPSRPAIRAEHRREVVITGVGIILPDALGNDAFVAMLSDAQRPMVTTAPPAIEQAKLADLLQTPRVRRMSDYVKLTLAATRLAVRDAGLETHGGPRTNESELLGENCAAVLGTTHGSAAYSAEYYQQIVREGIGYANAMLFAEGVPNAGAAHLSLMLGLKGPCQSIIGTRTAGLDAMRLASLRVACGAWDRAIISTAEEAIPLIARAYQCCDQHTTSGRGGAPLDPNGGFVLGSGAATLILESREAAEARGAKVYGTVEQGAAAMARFDDRRAALALMQHVLAQLGPVEHVITSANSTWLGQLETCALERCCGPSGTSSASASTRISSMYGHLAETFSVMPIAAIVAAALTGRMPRLHGARSIGDGRLLAARGDEKLSRFAVLASDLHGPIAGAAVRLQG